MALRLLDAEFPDENVRTFAVKILENLPDDQLEGFLLQLTQVSVKNNLAHLEIVVNISHSLGCEV